MSRNWQRLTRAAAAAALVPGATAAILDASGLGERRFRAMQLVPFSPLLALPSAAVAVISALVRWPDLTVAASMLATWQVSLARSGPTRAANGIALVAHSTGRGTEVRLATVNLRRTADTASSVIPLVLRENADLVIAEEFTPEAVPVFADPAFTARFPYRFEAPEDGYFGSAIYSRFPIIDAHDRPLGGRHMIVATVVIGSGPVTVVAVHLQAPIHRHDEEPWRAGFTDLADIVRGASGPVLLAGDWNATMGSRPFRRLLRSHNLLDAHLAVGRAWSRTWPADRHPFPPILLLDHVVVGGGVTVRAVGEHPVAGSDHLAVVADLVVP